MTSSLAAAESCDCLMNGLLPAVYWVNKGAGGTQNTFWGDADDAHLNGWLMVATLFTYHFGMAFVLHKADCPGLSFGQSTKKVAFNHLSTLCHQPVKQAPSVDMMLFM